MFTRRVATAVLCQPLRRLFSSETENNPYLKRKWKEVVANLQIYSGLIGIIGGVGAFSGFLVRQSMMGWNEATILKIELDKERELRQTEITKERELRQTDFTKERELRQKDIEHEQELRKSEFERAKLMSLELLFNVAAAEDYKVFKDKLEYSFESKKNENLTK